MGPYVYIKGEIFPDWVFSESCDSWGACAILAFRVFIVLDHPAWAGLPVLDPLGTRQAGRQPRYIDHPGQDSRQPGI